MSFTVTLGTVLVMLAYSIPGYLLVKLRKIPASAISSFATYLVYVCTPLQILYAMQQIDYSPYMLTYMGIALGVSLATMAGTLGIVYFVLRKRQAEVPYRICVTAASLGNVGFIGLPLLQALMPEYPQMQAFASMFFLSLNVIMWTLGSWITSRDKRYMNVKKVFLNPASIAVAVGLVLFFGRVRLTGQVGAMLELMGRMATPMCMLILGMRLATVPLKAIFTNPVQYVAVGLKLIVFPLMTLALCSLLPVERDFVRGVFVLSCVPVGNLVLSFAEMLGEGQDVAANVVLLSTMLSMITIPLMLMII
ncbi:MAG: AEC family transporter [Clostridia bacterium]|nr:AEC family transporter [Clostridia bacterium]